MLPSCFSNYLIDSLSLVDGLTGVSRQSTFVSQIFRDEASLGGPLRSLGTLELGYNQMSMFNFTRKKAFRSRFDLAIDLGTSNIVISRADGVVVNEASCVAVMKNPSGDRVIHSVGHKARSLEGKTPPSIEVIRPLAKGVICDFALASDLMKIFMKQALESASFFRRSPRVLLSLPYDVTPVEERAFYEACLRAGAREVQLIAEPVAAALGMGLNIFAPRGEILVDVGAGTTEIVILSLGGVAASQSIRIGGNDFDVAIQTYLANKHYFLVGAKTAEEIKLNLISPHNLAPLRINGFDKVSALPRSIEVSADEIRICLEPLIEKLVRAILQALEKCPEELSADLSNSSLQLSGGGALIGHLAQRISEETGLKVHRDLSPLLGVAHGEIELLKDSRLMDKFLKQR